MTTSIEETHVPLQGSERTALPGARFLAPADPNQRIEISVVVRPRQKPHPEQLAQAPQRRKQLTREEFEAAYGADPADLELSQAFGLQLAHYAHEGRTYRGRTGPVLIPKELAGVVEAVLGLDDRAQARTHFRRRQGFEPHTSPGTFTPVEVARLYNFPGLDGSGECIGIIELGGGYRTSDLRTYFRPLGRPMPRITAVMRGMGLPSGRKYVRR